MIATNPTKRHKVAFCADGHTVRVIPGHREVEVEDWVTFYNLLPGPVNVCIPSKDLFGETKFFTLKRRAKSDAFQVVKGALGCYPYAVYDPIAREFGHGSGVPIIIVLPGDDMTRI
jgi:hypothetical protein